MQEYAKQAHKLIEEIANSRLPSGSISDISKESDTYLRNYYDKILVYSVGTFSLSLALVSLAMNNNIFALKYPYILVPNIYWLYLSWVSFLSSATLILLSYKFKSFFLDDLSWFLTGLKFGEFLKLKQKAENYTEKVELTKFEEETVEALKSIKIKSSYPTTNIRKFRMINLFIQVFALTGTILLFIFAFGLVQVIVWS